MTQEEAALACVKWGVSLMILAALYMVSAIFSETFLHIELPFWPLAIGGVGFVCLCISGLLTVWDEP